MGLFSFLAPASSQSVADKIASRALGLQVDPLETDLAGTLSLPVHQLVSERVLLKVGYSLATLAFAAHMKRHPLYRDVQARLQSNYQSHFMTRPGVDARQGVAVMDLARQRYALRMPEELATLFDEQVRDPSAWQKQPPEKVVIRAVHPALLALVHGYAKEIGTLALARCEPLLDGYIS